MGIPLCEIEDCDKPINRRTFCRMHYMHLLQYGSPTYRPERKNESKGQRKTSTGYFLQYMTPDDPLYEYGRHAHKDSHARYMPQHRYVMAMHLGRPLLDHETVHHKNGNRQDNRIENLELWSHNQPSGQRVEDKVQWALEIIALYGSGFSGVE